MKATLHEVYLTLNSFDKLPDQVIFYFGEDAIIENQYNFEEYNIWSQLVEDDNQTIS